MIEDSTIAPATHDMSSGDRPKNDEEEEDYMSMLENQNLTDPYMEPQTEQGTDGGESHPQVSVPASLNPKIKQQEGLPLPVRRAAMHHGRDLWYKGTHHMVRF